ncbi:MAG: hypothetical protein COV60_01000 [Candidatus Magasanikbacteria bacterium CG11_big_fil_rev_8_21_14_0_20_43_7]|uniref:Uncharacterized protein n=1 Tax=Candidatus Magasanikbacteria bacterium CG11_big_fil_rev_8_21_14_0_20_43_7 TaxID=1974654 RepID=A0A2H0N368_9BACT|nr:MAG: hypothetical protein COV60_01000 [Candidatus Magasanikbacteria bacterium CG11_big_fil_rev_8_21_14_0_20_43_7]
MGNKKKNTVKTNTQQHIDQTIDALEASIHTGTGNDKKKDTPRQPHSDQKRNAPSIHIPKYNDRGYIFRQRLVLVTVLCIGLGVFGLWGWHIKTVIYDAGHGNLGGKTPLSSVGEQFSEAMLMAGARKEEPLLPPGTTSTLGRIIDHSGNTASTTASSTPTLDTLISSLQSKRTSSSATP